MSEEDLDIESECSDRNWTFNSNVTKGLEFIFECRNKYSRNGTRERSFVLIYLVATGHQAKAYAASHIQSRTQLGKIFNSSRTNQSNWATRLSYPC